MFSICLSSELKFNSGKIYFALHHDHKTFSEVNFLPWSQSRFCVSANFVHSSSQKHQIFLKYTKHIFGPLWSQGY